MSLNAEQLAMRRTRVGASEIGALLGIDPYKSAFDVFLGKNLPQAQTGEDHRSWGLDMEPSILGFHVRKRGYKLLDPPGSLAHPAFPLVCTPDALAVAADGTVALQAKNDQGYGQTEWGDPESDDAPMLYLAQATVEIGVLLAKGYDVVRDELVVSIRGAPPVAYPVKFDADLFGSLADVAAKFVRDHLETGKPPEGAPAEQAEYIRRRYANHGEQLLEATPELEELVRRVRERKAEVKLAEGALLICENNLKAAIGEAQGIAGLCTWKLQKRAAHTVKESSSRVLRLVAQKEL